MNRYQQEYIAAAMKIAALRNLEWSLPCNVTGQIDLDARWNLTALAGTLPPPEIWLGQFGTDSKALAYLNDIRARAGEPPREALAISVEWRNLYQAVIIHQIVTSRNKPPNVLAATRSLRLLGVEAGETPPWAVHPAIITRVYNAFLLAGESGKAALNFESAVKKFLDERRLVDIPGLAQHCLPLPDSDLVERHRGVKALRKRENGHHSIQSALQSLDERRSPEKLPDKRSFWSLIEIIFTRSPLTFSDHIRFAALKLLIVTGFRVDEAVRLPFDWCRLREFVDTDGTPAGARGGISSSIGIRHFAEKHIAVYAKDRVSKRENETMLAALFEEVQDVPSIFRDIVEETLSHIKTITAPLRRRIALQRESGRHIPEYPRDALVPAGEMYVRLTGNAIFTDAELDMEMVAEFKRTRNFTILSDLDEKLQNGVKVSPSLRNFYHQKIDILHADGTPMGGRIDWMRGFVRVRDAEDLLIGSTPTKHSDSVAARLADGTPVFPEELMFLMPSRNVVEGRNGGILNTELYYSVGRLSPADLDNMLDGSRADSIFRRYLGDEAKGLSLDCHEFRHLQNAELFRSQVADAIIAKRFNRRSVSQNQPYFHPSLREDLARKDTISPAEESLSQNTRDIFALMKAGKVAGPVRTAFLQIQDSHGDDAAFEFLSVEADGLHATPYGLCVNSFVSDPCEKHLSCFDGCNKLLRTADPSEQDNLQTLVQRMEKSVAGILAVPETKRTIGWQNQLRHAQGVIRNVRLSLATRPGDTVFPDGPDLSSEIGGDATSILDTPRKQRKSDVGDEERLKEILEAMIAENQTISYQAIVKASKGVFKHASNLTTLETLRALVEAAVIKQDKIRKDLGGNKKR